MLHARQVKEQDEEMDELDEEVDGWSSAAGAAYIDAKNIAVENKAVENIAVGKNPFEI